MIVAVRFLIIVVSSQQTYLYKAHLQELRNELQLLRQNDSAQLKADTEQILRDIESMNAKFSEIIGSLKTDVSMDINNHKTDGREVGTDTDLRIQEIHHKLIVKISDLKTKIETMKVETTRFIVCECYLERFMHRASHLNIYDFQGWHWEHLQY